MTHAFACPCCRRSLASVSPWCPGCGGDLRPLVQVIDLANHHFNEALRAARAGSWHQAAEHGAITLALQPDDVDAIVLLAKIARGQGRRDRSRQLWLRACELAPARPDIQRAVAESARPLPPWQRLRDLAPSPRQIAAAAPSRAELADGLRRALSEGARRAVEYRARIRSRARRPG